MDMRCSVCLRPLPERQEYIDNRIADMLAFYHVAYEDQGRFLSRPEVRQIKEALRSVDLSIKDIISYLGNSFSEGRVWERRGDDHAG
jgi:hypothetical protein